jgi:hypothetical protein
MSSAPSDPAVAAFRSLAQTTVATSLRIHRALDINPELQTHPTELVDTKACDLPSRSTIASSAEQALALQHVNRA